MTTYLSSRVRAIEEQPQVRGLPQVASAVAGFVGLAERGPLDTPTTITSWDQYLRTFGGLATGVAMPLQVRAFFLNGGRRAVIVRVLGAAPVVAGVTLVDRAGAPLNTLTVDASSSGAWGNDLSVVIAAPTNGEAAQFNLSVLKSGIVVETWPNLSMTDAAANYVETVINHPTTGSVYITVTDEDSVTVSPTNLPALGTTALTAGSNGGAVADATFTGGAAPGAGLNTLENAEITLVACPDQATVAVQNALIAFCENTREGDVFAVLDPPAGTTASTIRTHKGSLTSSQKASLYWPRVRIPNPSPAIFGTDDLITIAPSGAVMGMMARNDADTLAGPYTQPAGTEEGRLLGVVDVETDDVLRESVRDLVFPERINPIRFQAGVGIYVDGARALKGDGNFPSVGESRGVGVLNVRVKIALQFARHKNNTEDLRAVCENVLRGLLLEDMRRGAFASRNPAEAFYVDADVSGTGLNDAITRAQNKLKIRYGVATAKPAEFIDVLYSQDTRALQESLSGS